MDRLMFGASQQRIDDGFVKADPMKPLEEMAKNTADLNRQIEAVRRELKEHIREEEERRNKSEAEQKEKERRENRRIFWSGIATAVSLVIALLSWLRPIS